MKSRLLWVCVAIFFWTANQIFAQSDIDQTSEASEAESSYNKSENKKAEIPDEDIKGLVNAIKSRSENAIINAAANILSKDEYHLQTLNALGGYYYQNKKYGLAKIFYKRALKSHPSEAGLYNNMGIVYLAENDLRLALDSFKKSLNLKSNYKIGSTNLSSIYVKYRDFKSSISPLEEAYRQTRTYLSRGTFDSVEIANNYATTLMGLSEYDKAKSVFEEMVNANIKEPVPYLNYAILLVEVIKDKSAAVRTLSKIKTMTKDRNILRNVAELEKKIE